MPNDGMWSHQVDESDAPPDDTPFSDVADGPVTSEQQDRQVTLRRGADGRFQRADDESGEPDDLGFGLDDEPEAEASDEEGGPEGDPDKFVEPTDDIDDDIEILLKGGAKVTGKEVEDLFQRKAEVDTQFEAIEEVRRSHEVLREQNQKFNRDYGQLRERLFSFMKNLIPDEPDIALAGQDPSAYQYQVALRQKAVQEVEDLLHIDSTIHQVNQQEETAHAQAIRQREEQALLRYFPQLKDAGTRQKFNTAFHRVAKHFGFTEDEIKSTTDHRIGRLVYYANLGMKASKTGAPRKVAAKRTVAAKARPATQRRGNASAMKSLRETGSIDDAMKVNFNF